ncbi:patatin-like phospholipase family protein [Piscinibacter defluvii]|uniref:patatin-like phospholipase family protein n=1 Tax=Piscinibacter defluvii TaxID=1796922 RepID=UPI000FDE1A42|nr:patatin-like phospholipase family protein [Piscinibacter defluvii]
MAWTLPFTRTPLALALQGGGAHGAFTWGVLDALLEDGLFDLPALSGTSAGAMNALALAHGLLAGGHAGARAALQAFWEAVGTRLPFELLMVGPTDSPGLAPGFQALMHWTRLFSPYQLNPLGLNPLREVLAEQIDFERLRRPDAPRLFIAATHANSGRLRLFGNAELSIDAALASACLPTLHHAVMIDGEPYWDGGYSANPALFPLVRTGIADLLVVSLSPQTYADSPVSAEQIRQRALEFTFNAGFLREAVMLAQACAEARASTFAFGRLERRLRRLRTHLIDAHDDLAGLRAETRLIAHLPFLERLRDLGRTRAQAWLADQGARVGHASTVDFATQFAAPGAAA